MERRLNILELNDDCLGRIFQLLDLYDCEQVRKVCQRFRAIVYHYCKAKYKTWSKDLNDKRAENSFEWMARNVGNLVEQLNLLELTEEEFEKFCTYKFPNVHTLKLGILENRSAVLANAVPNVSKLHLEGRGLTMVGDMPALVNLTELVVRPYIYPAFLDNLTFDWERQRRHHSFCATPYLNAQAEKPLKRFWRSLKDLPNLRRVTCLHADDGDTSAEMDCLLKAFGPRVITLRSEATQYMKSLDSFRKLNNLRALFLQCSLNYDVVAGLTYNQEDPLYLWHIIELCPTLEVLAVPHEWIGNKIQLPYLKETLHKQNDRKQPLELRGLVKCMKSFRGEYFSSSGRSGLLHITVAEYPKNATEWTCVNETSFEIELAPDIYSEALTIDI